MTQLCCGRVFVGQAATVWHAVGMVCYYGLLEVLPCSVLLWINRRKPPRTRRVRSLRPQQQQKPLSQVLAVNRGDALLAHAQ